MKTLHKLIMVIALAIAMPAQAQTADEILDTYFENIGGKENLKAIKGMKMTASVNQGGMEIPLEIYQMSDGRQATVIKLQGQEFKQGVFDGESLWGTNFQTGKAEKSDAETTANFKLNTNDFPDAFLDYKEKGYTVELMGTETIEGTETFKIKLVKEPLTIEGETVEDISFYYFDAENFVPLALESQINQGPAKGQMQYITFSDYQEVDGIYMPFSMSQGVKNGPSQPISMTTIELNPEVDEAIFAFPEEVTDK
ncbi:hypothetical protein SAMN04490243_2365 [Robiginitalea myxolifaciens]|uniref:Outer membrane lipoprotein-sorting protein n=1 Tax=Robiginitalea myxolifaciens TaxID=400055 RepID=A0A1I6H711_9FLAO|nr:outer membrane lipoprotein-sorting protein [Robiginitalea myxolifaciens]SFR50326.1 hypothetical protein SAMN04490243_2365 [Robiginitalea myxolifaciens]